MLKMWHGNKRVSRANGGDVYSFAGGMSAVFTVGFLLMEDPLFAPV